MYMILTNKYFLRKSSLIQKGLNQTFIVVIRLNNFIKKS
ncbi:hypothetical protein SaO11_00897 [Staphylococcus aureus O11]|nr:hypothetical protein SaO11_00897 [Staphylococcus aureus O11]